MKAKEKDIFDLGLEIDPIEISLIEDEQSDFITHNFESGETDQQVAENREAALQ
jgi:hypothetical protein